MKKIIYIFLLFTLAVRAQEFPCTLLGEGNGDIVRLKCIPSEWPEQLEGYHIKRREISSGETGEWKQLSTSLMSPQINGANNYAHVEPSVIEQQRLVKKLDSLLKLGRTKEIDSEKFYQSYLSNPSGIKNLTMGFLVDYDFAIIQGFGLVDRNISVAERYEYGLFAKFKNKETQEVASSTFQWKYGDKIDLQVSYKSKIRRNKKNEKLRVIWNFKTAELREKRITAFKVFRQIKGSSKTLIQGKTFIDASDANATLTIDDKITNNSEVDYFAVPISVMGTEGDAFEVNYNDKTSIVELNAPVLLTPEISGDNSIVLQWIFNSEDESYIKGFRVIRSQENSLGKKSFFTSADQRQFDDKTLEKSGDYNYEVQILRKDESVIEGQLTKVSFTFITPLNVPKDLKGSFSSSNSSGENIIRLEWEKINTSSQQPVKYKVYSSKPYEENLTYDSRIPEITESFYELSVNKYNKGYWEFAVTCIDENGNESEQSLPISVLVPSSSIPSVTNAAFELKGGTVVINWSYYQERVPDLLGFRLYKNNELITDETRLTASVREWNVKELSEGKNIFTIEAVTKSGIVSPKINGLIRYQKD